MIKSFLRQKKSGMTTSNMVLLGLGVLIIAIGAFAVIQSIQLQSRLKDTFAGWNENFPGYAKATTIVGRDKKSMILYFYAPWCPHCKKFTRELLASDEVRNYLANDRFVKVRVYPETSPQDQALMDAYKAYGATGYPSFFVIRGPTSLPVRVEPTDPDAKEEKLLSPKAFIAKIDDVLAGKMPEEEKKEKPMPIVVPGAR